MGTVLALVTARSGSKGVPGKNTAMVGGWPLLWWTVSAALRCPQVSRTVLSTDCPGIAAHGLAAGAEVPFLRPAPLATDEASHADVVLHALDALNAQGSPDPEWLLLLQPTSPLRTCDDISAAVGAALAGDVDAVVSVCRSKEHPLLAVRCRGGMMSPFVDRAPAPGSQEIRRQALEPSFHVNGAIYLVRTSVFRALRTFMPARTLALEMPRGRSLQVDSPEDIGQVSAALRMPGRPGVRPPRIPVAVVGNGIVGDYAGMARAIDAFPEVVRFNYAALPENVARFSHMVGSRTTMVALACAMTRAQLEGMDRRTRFQIMLQPEALKEQDAMVRDLHELGFATPARSPLSGFASPVLGEPATPRPTTGMATIKLLVAQGALPVLFNFSQDDDLRHYHDGARHEPGTPGSLVHNMKNERASVAWLAERGLVQVDGPASPWRHDGWDVSKLATPAGAGRCGYLQ